MSTPRLYTRGEIAEKRVSYLADVELDVQVLQDLLVHVRRRVPKEGSVLFYRDEDVLYEVAFASMRAFERFKRVCIAAARSVDAAPDGARRFPQ